MTTPYSRVYKPASIQAPNFTIKPDNFDTLRGVQNIAKDYISRDPITALAHDSYKIKIDLPLTGGGSPPPPIESKILLPTKLDTVKLDLSVPELTTVELVEEKKCCSFKVSDLYYGPLALIITISALATFILTRPGVWLGEALHYLGMRGLANFVPLAIAGAGGFFPGICYLGAHAAFECLEKLDPPSDYISHYVHGLHSWMCTTVHDPLLELTNFS